MGIAADVRVLRSFCLIVVAVLAVCAAGCGGSQKKHSTTTGSSRSNRTTARPSGPKPIAILENYTGNSDPRYLEAMARVIKRGLETWEHVLIRRGVAWEPYVTKAARRGAERCIADAEFYVPLV